MNIKPEKPYQLFEVIMTTSAVVLIVALVASVSEPKAIAATDGISSVVSRLDEQNKQLARIANALETIAGTGDRKWSFPR